MKIKSIIKIMNFNTSTQKIVAGLLSFAMVLTLVVGLTVAPAKADTTTFTRNLTVGSRGDDVRTLQATLAAKGFFTYAGGPTGYFGSITKTAVAAWQASVGITPAVGYFGPISRAQISGVVVGGGTPSVGCAVGNIYNSITGERCANTSPVSTTEGSLTVTLATSPVNQTGITDSSNVDAYGINLKAKLGDVKVDRADLKFVVTNTITTGTENPGNFINTITVKDGSTVLKSWTVGSSDFIKDSSSVYYIRLSDIGLTVPKDGEKNLVFSLGVSGSIDQDRSVAISGYGDNSLRTSSGAGIITYYNISTPSVAARTQTFTKGGTSTLTLSDVATNPASSTVRVDTTASIGAEKVVMQEFAVKSTTGESTITSIALTSYSTGAGASTLYLYEGSTLLSSITNASSTSFTGLSLKVGKDVTKTLTLKADFPKPASETAFDGSIATTSVTSVTYDKPNGGSDSVSTAVAGTGRYLYGTSANWTFVSAGTPTKVINGEGTSALLDSWTNTFVLKATPKGGAMTVPTTASFAATVSTSTGAVAATIKEVAVEGNPSLLSENVGYNVSVTVTAATTSVKAGTQVIRFNITSAASSIDSHTVTQTWGLNTFNSNSLTVSGGTL